MNFKVKMDRGWAGVVYHLEDLQDVEDSLCGLLGFTHELHHAVSRVRAAIREHLEILQSARLCWRTAIIIMHLHAATLTGMFLFLAVRGEC